MEQLDTSLANEQPVASMELTSEPDVGSDESNAFDDTNKSGNVFDNGDRVKIGARLPLLGCVLTLVDRRSRRAASLISKVPLAFFRKGLPGLLA
jgi:hypothetical protein